MEFLRLHQLNIMLVLFGVNLGMAILVLLTGAIKPKRRAILLCIELGSSMLLFFDRLAYLYQGDTSQGGYYMVRITNFLVFFLSLFAIFVFEFYLRDLYLDEGGLNRTPIALKIARWICYAGFVCLIISQFTGWYYTFDAENVYHRGRLFFLSYVFPLGVMAILLAVIIYYREKLSRTMYLGLLLFALVPLCGAVIQYFVYGISFTNICLVGMAVLLYFFVLDDVSKKARMSTELEISYAKNNQRISQTLFEQTAETLATAIDAKDKYTKGHSLRVAEYAKMIAERAGKDPKACYEIYYAALLHDVGKIGISDAVLGKVGKLEDDEYEEMKRHSLIGSDILSSITKFPYLSIAAKYHHERYDGKGYPEHLKGEDTPEIARIIAVADAYDAMSSNRSYRAMLPQQEVKEEILKGAGNQFDPKFAKIMLKLIEEDEKYEMKQRESLKELAGRDSLYCYEYRDDCSEGIRMTECITHIHIHSKSEAGKASKRTLPSLVLFDSLDERVHYRDGKEKEMSYLEYCIIRLDGTTECSEARKIQTDVNYLKADVDMIQAYAEGVDYDIDAVRVKDHVSIKVRNKYQNIEYTIALPNSIRYTYLALTGEYCHISQVVIRKDDKKVPEEYIARIADEVSYLSGPTGDVPNIQIDNWCSAATEGIPSKDKMRIQFHAKSLPTARLIWHCPYIRLFYSEDRKVNGPGFKNFTLVRLDGENWDSDEFSENEVKVEQSEEFIGWDDWKEKLKEGFECIVDIEQKDGRIYVSTSNFGMHLKTVTKVLPDVPEVYVSLTGDEVALTNIRITE